MENVEMVQQKHDLTSMLCKVQEIIELYERTRQRTMELESVNKELESFCFAVSHDLLAPLRHINFYSQALLEDYEDKFDSMGQKYLQKIKSVTKRMEQFIHDLLMLSRVNRGDFLREHINLSIMAHNIVEELKKSQPERQVIFSIVPDLTVIGSHSLLWAVLENLLGNAWKFSEKTEEAIIEFGATEVNGKIAYFVRDNGSGFDMTYAEKLFAPLQRLPGASDFEGQGIGLASVQRIINRHGGHVWAEGELGKGATFYFTVPAGDKNSANYAEHVDL